MFHIKTVSAHCDVPCGIYETDTMRHSAATCQKMIHDIIDLGNLDSTEKHATFVRMVTTKELHADKCKHELYTLWSDYFKPQHFEKFPNLHDIFWQTTKQVSKVKQTLNMDEATKLITMVDQVAQLFTDSKQP